MTTSMANNAAHGMVTLGLLTLILRRGGGLFPRQLFWAIEYQHYNASFHKSESKFGGSVWVGGVVKKFSVEWRVGETP